MVASELDIEQPQQLTAYLRGRGKLSAGEVPEIRPLSGGVSNRVVLVRRASGEAWVVKQSLPRLRVEVEWFSDPGRGTKEALATRWLERLLPTGAVPRLVFEDPDHHLLAIEAVPDPHQNWKSLLLSGQLEGSHVQAFARLLATIHAGARFHFPAVAEAFRDRSVFESLRIEPYFLYTARQVPEVAEFLFRVVDEVRSHQLTLVHGDYSPKNVLIHRRRLILLDHEVAHLGDPAFDLGFSLTHLLSKAHHLQDLRARFGQAAIDYWRTYLAVLGDAGWTLDLERRTVRVTLACLLARVAGRSPLEYLTPVERERQGAAVIRLMRTEPDGVSALVTRFLEELAHA
jgi:5-methylthioribose kinase